MTFTLRQILLTFLCLILAHRAQAGGSSEHRIEGHVPRGQLQTAHLLGPMDHEEELDLSFGLPLRHQADLEQLIKDLHDPRNPQYGKYLSTEQFTERFGPLQEDVDVVIQHLKNAGFRISSVSPNRVLVRARARVGILQKTLNIHLNRYQGRSRDFFSTEEEPSLPTDVARRVVHIAGLQNSRVMQPHLRTQLPRTALQPAIGGTGPRGGLAPQDIVTAYSLPGGSSNGAGQTLALFELDGYLPGDIQAYANYFQIRQVPLENILVDGFDGSAGSGSDEVTLDIELMNAIAPGASRILVYEGPNTDRGVLDTYSRIANDNRASAVSTSWGLSEYDTGDSYARLEAQFFQQIAAQGQSFYAASGDSGAYDAQSKTGTPILSADDPSSQPYVTGVGGTRLNLGAGQTYGSEVVWNSGGGSTGGGVSTIWTIPYWQASTTTLSSQQMRNVPDVALDADPNTGYAVYSHGQWQVIGGTSAAAPLWAGFTAILNQSRAQSGLGVLGFANPTIYRLGNEAAYSNNFHDITVGNNNYYSAGLGYDNTTGWGSFQGANLLATLTQKSQTQTVTFTNLPASLVWGDTITLTASSSSQLPVTYTAGPSPICTVSGAALTAQYPGTCSIQALQSGGSGFDSATTVSTVEVIPPTYPGVNRSLKVAVPTGGGTVTSSPVGIACGDGGSYCSQGFKRDSVIALTATPSDSRVFIGWSGGTCRGKLPICRFKMSSNRTAVARFR